MKTRCFECSTECDDDNLCSGCNHYVCDNCDVNYNMPFGPHNPEEHLIDPDEKG